MTTKKQLRKQIVILSYQLEKFVRILESDDVQSVFDTASEHGNVYAGEKIGTRLVRGIVRECGYEFSTTKVIPDEAPKS